MDDRTAGGAPNHATAARIYDYLLGGIHNFPADQEAARRVVAQFPNAPVVARANRAFVRRAVGYLAGAGMRQYLDVGSGIPTGGNVHEVAQEIAPDSRVVYVDIDPVAVADSLEILDGNRWATAVRGDLREPQQILDDPAVRQVLDLERPVALILTSMLHFVADDAAAYASVAKLVDALPAGSHLVISHGAAETFDAGAESFRTALDTYRRQAATTGAVRSRDEVARFFDGLDLLDPGVVWLHEWRSSPQERAEFADDPRRAGEWAAVAAKR